MKAIPTPRLELVPATAESVRAEMEDRERFFDMLGVEPAAGWPSEDLQGALPVFLDALSKDPESAGWWTWYWIDRSKRALVGGGGFKGRPATGGLVEIGYETRPAYRRRGYAAEAVGTIANWALGQPVVNCVIAETGEDNAASIGLLRRLAFEEVGVGSEPDLRRFELATHAV